MPDLTPALQMALNSALSERATIRSRQSLMTGSVDNKRPDAWCSYGYPNNLCFADYYKLWEREGGAHGAVMRVNEKCWETEPEVIEGEPEDRATAPTVWEKQFKKLAKRLKLWEKFREADMRRLVGYYSGIILQVADNKAWDQPIGKASDKQLSTLFQHGKAHRSCHRRGDLRLAWTWVAVLFKRCAGRNLVPPVFAKH